ncbi:MAG: hypothetical protein HC879_21015 [Leptolyngbyaceae cyanobacterium SL_5_9]|nr:hypothetical protein [Leptolyngbyaceae cyanobacterium SL_5_9]NJO76339.1 hypothetical protein [Leptolyngbyaceae cyanobacterium RM1_406_9]
MPAHSIVMAYIAIATGYIAIAQLNQASNCLDTAQLRQDFRSELTDISETVV